MMEVETVAIAAALAGLQLEIRQVPANGHWLSCMPRCRV